MFRDPSNVPGDGVCSAQALAAAALEAIGKIRTASGSVTVMRADGEIVRVSVGDLVYRGDTIETEADGAVGITFADGTAFDLSAAARLVLNEFVCDPAGTPNSALFSLVQGAFSFVAGKIARTGGLRIDTPFATIRGSAQDRGIGVLTLAALTFAAIKESEAASRHDAFLDDGTITYKDLPHGTFEIVTRDGRVIMADDPGETIVVDPTGSVARLPNSSSRMAELQQAQHSALATFSLGQEGGAAGGSSSPGFDIPVQLQPINFSQPRNDAPTEIVTTHITAASAGFIPVPPQLNPPPPVVTPVLGSAGFSMVTETVNTTGSTHFDTVSSGTLTFTDLEFNTVSATMASMTWSGGATPPSGLAEVLAGALSITTESANPVSGSIATTFSAADRNFDFLAANETLTIVYDVTVTDNQGVSLTRPVTITIIGTNDVPVLAADASGPHTVTEGLNTTGRFVFTDVDLTDHHTVSTSVTSAIWSGGATLPSGVAAALAGALSATASDGTGSGSGSVAATFSAADSAFDFLAAGQTLTVTYNVTVTDNNGGSSSQPVTFTITGTNDAPTLEPVTGPTYTDTPAPDHFNAVAGTLVGADVDLPQTLTYGIVGGTADNSLNGYNVSLTGTFGKLYVNSASGAYTFVPNDATINALTAPTTENFTFTVSDGSLSAQQNFLVTINGTAEATVSISDGTPNPATEGTDATISFTVTLSAAVNVDTVITYSTVDGSAVAGADFTGATNATVTIPAGATTATITIPVLNDTIVEATEQFRVVLSSALVGSNGPLVITNTTGTATIIDDDTAAITLSGPPSVAEGATTGNYTVSLSGVGLGAGQSVTFTLDSASGTATEGTDFSALPASALHGAAGISLSTTTGANGVITVTATNNTGADLATGAALVTFTMTTTQDSVVEGTENFTVTLGSSTATVVTPTVTTSIIDDDTAAITLSGPPSVAEGATTGNYTVSLSGLGLGAGQSVTFTLDSASGTATEGTDFSALPASALHGAAGISLSTTTGANGVITVTATNNTGADLATGAALVTFTMTTTQDSVVEGTENFTVTLGSSTATVVTPTVTTSIIDDDTAAITLSGPPSVAEGATTGNYTVSLSGLGLGAGQSVTFTLDSASGTATEGTDFSALPASALHGAAGISLSTTTGANGVITVTATNNTGADLATGAALVTFTMTTTQDSVVEGTENFTVTLGSSTATVVTPTVTTSIIDDDTAGITLSGPPSVAEGATTGNYTVSLSGLGLGAGQSVTFTLDSASGTATEGTDFSALPASALHGAAGISLSTTTGANGVITVTATNNTGADLATGAALVTFTMTTTQDSVVEGTENFTVTLGSSTATVVTPTVTTSIIDDDTAGITLSGPPSVAEGATTGNYTVSLSGLGLGAGQSVTFTLDSASGTATEGTDFSALPASALHGAAGISLSTTTGANGVITVTATNNTGADLATGAALVTFTMTTTQDSVVEGTENFTVTLGSSTATVVTPTVTTSIIDDDTAAITLSGPPSVAEGATTGNYTVSLSGVGLGAGQSVTFTLDSASGTATEGTDFSALPASALHGAAGISLSTTTGANGVITVTATNNTGADLATGAALVTFTMTTTQDSVVEGTENFTVTLGSSTATVVTPTVTTSIIDDDTAAITLSGPPSVAEGATTGNYTVSLSGLGLGAGQSVTFTLDSASGTATEGTDFSALPASALHGAAGISLSTTTGANGVITVTATNNTGADLATGAALLSFTIATTPDSAIEGTENFTVTLASAAAVVNPTITTSITDVAPFALDLPDLGSLQGNGLNKNTEMGTFASGFTYSLGAGSSSGFVLSGTGNAVLSTGNENIVSGTYTLNVIATDQFGISHTTVVKIWVGTPNNDTIDLATLGNSSGINLAYGLNGVDKITGGGALDFLIGGQQPNTLAAGSGSEVFAASGNDTIVLNGLSFSDDIIYQLTPTDQIDLTSLLFVPGSMSATGSFNGTTTSLVVSNGTTSFTLNLGGDYSSSTWQFAKDAGTGTIFHDPPADSGTATIDSGASPASMLTTATDSVSFVSGTNQVIGTDPNDLLLLSSPFTAANDSGDGQTADGTVAALKTAVSDPAGGETTSATIDGNSAVADTTGTPSGSGSLIVNSGTALELTSISHKLAGILTDHGKVEVTNPHILARTALSRELGTLATFERQIAIASVIVVVEYLADSFKLASAGDGGLRMIDAAASSDVALAAVSETRAVKVVDTADTQATPVAADEAAVAVLDAAITPDGGIPDLTSSSLPSDFALTESEGHQPPVVSDTISLAYSEFADHGLHGSGKDHNTALNVATTNSAEGRTAAKASVSMSSHSTSSETGSDGNSNGGDAARIHDAIVGHSSIIDTVGTTISDSVSSSLRGATSGHLNDQSHFENATPGTLQSLESPTQAALHVDEGRADHNYGAAAEHSPTIDTPATTITNSDAAGVRAEPPGHGNDKSQLGNADPGNNGLGHQSRELPTQAASQAAKDSPPVTAGEDAKGDHADHSHGAAAKDSSTFDTPATTVAESDAAGVRAEPPGPGKDKSPLGNADPGNNGLGHQSRESPSQASVQTAKDIPPVTAVENAKGDDAAHTHGAAAKDSSTIDTPAPVIAESDAPGARGEPPGHVNDQAQLPSQASAHAVEDLPTLTGVEDTKGDRADHGHGAAAKDSSTIDTPATTIADSDAPGVRGEPSGHVNDPPQLGNADPGNNGHQFRELPSQAAAHAVEDIPTVTAVEDTKGARAADHSHGAAAGPTVDAAATTIADSDTPDVRGEPPGHVNDQPQLGNADPGNNGLGHQSRESPSQASVQAAKDIPSVTAVENAKGDDAAHTQGAAAKDSSTIDTTGAAVAHTNSSGSQGAAAEDMSDQFHFANTNPGTSQSTELPSQAASHPAVEIPASTTDNSGVGHGNDFNAAALPDAVEDAKGSDKAQIRGAAAKDLSTTDVAGATVVGHNDSSSFQGALSGEMNDQFHFANANPGNKGLGQQSLELASQTTSHAAVDIPAATTELGQIVDDVLTQAAQAALDPGTTPDHNSQLPWTNTDQHNRSSDFITHA